MTRNNTPWRGRPVLHGVIDYGTANLVSGFVIASERCSARDLGKLNTYIVRLQHPREEIPQIVGYRRNDDGNLDFTWGVELSNAIDNKDTNVKACFQRLKLAIFGDCKDARRMKRNIETRLKELGVMEKTVEDLYIRHLVCILAAWKDEVQLCRPGLPISSLDTCCFFGVPELLDAATRRRLQKLVKKAGWPEVHLISEAEATAAWHVSREIDTTLVETLSLDSPCDLIGKKMGVLDVGGWTANWVVYEITGDTEDGPGVGMKDTGEKSSLPCGSEWVTLELSNEAMPYIERRGGLEFLNITQDIYEQQYKRESEQFKASFVTDRYYNVPIEGPRVNGSGQPPTIWIPVKACQVEVKMDRCFTGIETMLDEHGVQDVDFIFTCGGFMKSEYMLGRLRDRYMPDGIKMLEGTRDGQGGPAHSVVRGALARFLAEPAQVPSKFALGWLQDETFDKDFHDDLTPRSHSLVRVYPESPKYALNRWRTFVKLGTKISTGSEVTTEIAYLEAAFRVTRDGDYAWTMQIFSTEEDIPDHAAAKRNGKLLPSIRPYDRIALRISEYVMDQYREPGGTKGLVTLRLKAIMQGMNTKFEAERAKPGHEFYPDARKTNGNWIWTPSLDDEWIPVPLDEADANLHDEKYSAFVQRKEGHDRVRHQRHNLLSSASSSRRDPYHSDPRPGKLKKPGTRAVGTRAPSSTASSRGGDRDSVIEESGSSISDRVQTVRTSNRFTNMLYSSPSQTGAFNLRHFHRSQE